MAKKRQVRKSRTPKAAKAHVTKQVRDLLQELSQRARPGYCTVVVGWDMTRGKIAGSYCFQREMVAPAVPFAAGTVLEFDSDGLLFSSMRVDSVQYMVETGTYEYYCSWAFNVDACRPGSGGAWVAKDLKLMIRTLLDCGFRNGHGNRLIL